MLVVLIVIVVVVVLILEKTLRRFLAAVSYGEFL